MLPFLRSSTDGVGFNSDTSIASGQLDVPKPTGMKNDDYLVMVVTNKGGGLPTCTGGDAWTLLGDATSGNAMGLGTTRGAVFGRPIADTTSEPATYTVGNVSDSAVAEVICIAGVDTEDPIQGFNLESCTASDHTIAGLTTDRDDCLIVGMAMLADNVSSNSSAGSWACATDPTSLTQPTGANDTTSAGTDSGVSFATAGKATAGATGDFHWTPFSTDADSVVAILAFNPDQTPTWRSDGTAVEATTGNLSPGKPSGLADDDVLFVWGASKTGAPTGVTGGADSFTQIGSASITGLDLVLFAKVITNAAGEPATYTVTCPGTGDVRVARAHAVRGCDVADYIDDLVGQSYASGTNQAPAVTTEGHTLVVGILIHDDDGGMSPDLVYTDPASMTTQTTLNTLTGTDISGRVRTAAKQLPGATGTGSFTPTNAADNVVITMSLRGEAPLVEREGDATSSARATATATGQKDVSGSASGSAHPAVTASGFGPVESHSGAATVTGKPAVTASGVADVPSTFATNKSAMML